MAFLSRDGRGREANSGLSEGSGDSLMFVSLRASSGVLTIMAPDPRVPERALEATRLGSDILTGFAGEGIE